MATNRPLSNRPVTSRTEKAKQMPAHNPGNITPPPVITDEVEPIFTSVEGVARILSLGRTRCYELLDQGVLPSRYIGRRRLVPLAAVREYADQLPTTRPPA